jgi:hypothetical protein
LQKPAPFHHPRALRARCGHSQDQCRPSIRSRIAAESFRSTPGSGPPRAFETGRITRGLLADFGRERASTKRKPCSMSEVKVSPLSRASRFAWRSKFSSRRTAVLICLHVSISRQYVKTWLYPIWAEGTQGNREWETGKREKRKIRPHTEPRTALDYSLPPTA